MITNRLTIGCAVALCLVGCGGGPATHAPALGRNYDATPLVAEAEFYAEHGFGIGDTVIYCATEEEVTIQKIQYPPDGTVQLTDGRWVAESGLVQDGPPYTCGGGAE